MQLGLEIQVVAVGNQLNASGDPKTLENLSNLFYIMKKKYPVVVFFCIF